MSACAIDGSPTGDGSQLCSAHRNRLEQRIAEMPALARELELTLTRQTSAGERNGGRSAEKPLPYDAGASDALSGIRGFLVGWTRDLAEHGGRWPANDETSTLAVWLVAQIATLAQHQAADAIAGEADDVTAAAARVIDRHAPQRLYTGRCGARDTGPECQHDVYARPGATYAVCEACGTRHEVAPRRDRMAADLEDRLLTAGELASVLGLLTHDDTLTTDRARARIAKWITRGKLHQRAWSMLGHPTYRVGDVRDMIERTKGRAA